MNFVQGQRIYDAIGTEYRLLSPKRKTPWNTLWSAEKLFWNYRFQEQEFYLSNESERLPVLIRCPSEKPENSTAAFQSMSPNSFIEFEASQVLGDASCRWFSQPLDLFQPHHHPAINCCQTLPHYGKLSTHGRAEEMVLCFSNPQGRSIASDLLSHAFQQPPFDRRLRWNIILECLELLSWLESKELMLSSLHPDELIVDSHGHLYFIGTDHIFPCQQASRWRNFVTSERFIPTLCAPEMLDPNGWLDHRTDLYSWAVLSVWILSQPTEHRLSNHADFDLTAVFQKTDNPIDFSAQCQKILQQSLARTPDGPMHAKTSFPQLRTREWTSEELFHRWGGHLNQCLQPNPSHRPRSATALMHTDSLPNQKFRLKTFVKKLFSRQHVQHGYENQA